MNNICDIFLPKPVNSKNLKFISILDNNFEYDEKKAYNKYIGISVNRIKLIPLISLLKNDAIEAFSVPIEYRDNINLTKYQAFNIAKIFASKNSMKVIFESNMIRNGNPLIWNFSTIPILEEKAGGVISVDRVDGHIWSLDELDMYMYDYNNIF